MTAPASSPVRYEVSEGVGTLTLADPDNRNTLGQATIRGLLEGVAAAAADPATRVIVLTNLGNTFCGGADLREQSTEAGRATSFRFDEVLSAILASPKPVVGRIDGHAVAGGVGLAAACDISIARDDALLGFTEVRIGVIPAVISVVCLPKMRRADAMEAFLRGNRFSAQKAAEIGLITRAVPAADLDVAVGEVVDDLRRGGPLALDAAKRLVFEVPTLGDEAFETMTSRSRAFFASAEAAEGMAAFREKRPASWTAPAS